MHLPPVGGQPATLARHCWGNTVGAIMRRGQKIIRFSASVFCASVIFNASPALAACEQLHTAVSNADYNTIDQELAWSTDINCLNAQGEAPLDTAIYTLNSSLVSYLLSRGASVNVHDKNGWTPLDVADDGYEFVSDSEVDALDNVIATLKNAGGTYGQ